MRSPRLLVACGLVLWLAPVSWAEASPPLGGGLRRLDWWDETDVRVEKLDTWEESEQTLFDRLPSSHDSLDWYVLGPIPVEKSFEYYRFSLPTELVDLTGTLTMAGRQFSWRRLHPPEKTGAGLDLAKELRASRGGLAYLYRELVTGEPVHTKFFLGFHSGCRLWLNGEELFFSDSGAYADTDRIEIPVQLEAGVNRILVKTFSRSSHWVFYFHTGDVNPRKARIKGRWLLAELFPEAPDRQLSARLAVLRELVSLEEDRALRAAGELLSELAQAGPPTTQFVETVRGLAQRAQDRGSHAQAERTWQVEVELLQRAPEELRRAEEPLALAGLAASRGRVGDVRGAQRTYERLVAVYPEAEVTEEALWVLGEFYRSEGRTWLALPCYQQLLETFPATKRAEAARKSMDWCRKFTGDRPRQKGSFSAGQLLSRAARLEEAGDAAGAARLCLQALWEWPAELVRVAPDRLVSVALVVGERLQALVSSLPPELRATVAARDRGALAQHLGAGRDQELPGLLRRYPLAPSAAASLLAWAESTMEAGQVGRAAAGLALLLREHRLSPDQKAQVAAQLAFCAQALQDRHLGALARGELAALPPATTLTWGGGRRAVADVLAWLASEMPTGDRPALGLEELAERPVTVRLLPDLVGWKLLNPRWPSPRTPVPWRPLVGDGTVYCHDQQAARAFTPGGELLWRSWPYPRPVRVLKGHGFKGPPVYLGAADDHRFYALQLAADDADRSTTSALFAYDRATGQVLWSTENEPGLTGYWVASPPVAAFDRLYAVAYSSEVLGEELLLALDPTTGELMSTTLLATGNGRLKVFQDAHRTSEYDALSLLPPPVADEGRLYAATQMGHVLAVDALTGEVDWVTEYPRTSLVSTDDTFMVNYICRGLSPPVLFGDLLLVVPRDSGELLALDRGTGELRWRRSEYEFSELWGVGSTAGQAHGAEQGRSTAGEQLVVAHDVPGQVLACSLQTGEVRWCWRPPTGKAGRGLVAADRVLVPTGGGLYELSLADGTERGSRLLERAYQEVSGLVVTAEGLVAGWEEGLLFWPTALAPVGDGLDETFVQALPPPESTGAREAGAETQPERSETEIEGVGSLSEPTTSAEVTRSTSPAPTDWAPVAPVAGRGAAVAVFARENGQDVVSWDGRWLSLTRIGRRPHLSWRRALRSDVSFLQANSGVVVAASGPELVAVERETGEELWRWTIPVREGGYWSFDGTSTSPKALLVTDSLVLVGLYRSVWALDAKTGRERWHYGMEYDLQDVSVDSEFVYAVTTYYRGYLRTHALSLEDGRPRRWAEYRGLDARNLSVVLEGRRLWVVDRAHRRITAYDIAQSTQLWQEPNIRLNQPDYLGQDDRLLFFRVQTPRGQAPGLLAVGRMGGAQAFMVEDASFQIALKAPDDEKALSSAVKPRPYVVVDGADIGLEKGTVLLCQQGADLVAWPAYEKEPARRWPLFEDQEVLTSLICQGPYFFLATMRPYAAASRAETEGLVDEGEAKDETAREAGAPSVLFQPTVRIVELPEAKELAVVPLPPLDTRVEAQGTLVAWERPRIIDHTEPKEPGASGSPESLLPVAEGLLHLGPAGLVFLAPATPDEALEELRALHRSPDLLPAERALLETLIASLEPTALVARGCGDVFQVTVDGDLGEWSDVPAVPFLEEEEAGRQLFPEAVRIRPAPEVPLSGSLRLARDEEWFYLAVEVADEIHRPATGAGASWRSDSLLLEILPAVLSAGSDRSLSLKLLGPTGTHRLEERVRDTRVIVRLGIGRKGTTTSYEVAVARSSLAPGPVWPPLPGELRLALAVTDRDDSGLREIVTFPPGPRTGRALESYARVISHNSPRQEAPELRRAAPSAEDRMTLDRLQRRVSLNFRDKPISQVVDSLASLADVSVVMEQGIRGDLPVTVGLRDVEVDDALDFVCDMLDLKWTLRRGVVWISSAQAGPSGRVRR